MFGEVPEPLPRVDEAVVQVEAFAPNPGDLAALLHADAGSVPGWDGAGLVVRAASDGSGPAEGQRVLFLDGSGGWAERRAVATSRIGVATSAVDVAQLSLLPVPATSALRALRRFGSLLGRRLVVSGANSAVGSVAVQLGAASGAEVIAVARRAESHEYLQQLGATRTFSSIEHVAGPVHAVLDVVGGAALVHAYGLLVAGGTAIALGHSSGEGEYFPYGAFIADPASYNRTITSFYLGAENDLADEMTLLASMVASGNLDAGRYATQPWEQLGNWVAQDAPRPDGRVVFRID